MSFSAVSRAPLANLQAYEQRMGETLPWASSVGTDFNFDFNQWLDRAPGGATSRSTGYAWASTAAAAAPG